MNDRSNIRNLVINVALAVLSRLYDSKLLFQKCPIQGWWVSKNMDYDNVAGFQKNFGNRNLAPEGFHKYILGLISQKNVTYGTVELVIMMKGKGLNDMSMLNMG